MYKVKLRKLSWSGIPKQFRPMVWQLLMVIIQFKLEHQKY